MNEEYIKELHKLYDTNVEEKIRKVENGIKKSIQEYELEDIKEFPNLHYNYLFKAYSRKYLKDVVVKIILDASSNNEEIQMLRIYNGNHCVKMLDENKEDGILVLEYIEGENLSIEKDKEKQVQVLVDLVDNLVVEKKDEDDTLIPEYKAILKNAIIKNDSIKKEKTKYKEQIERLDSFKDDIIYALNELESQNKQKYYLHGDLHTYNIIKSKNGYLAIDPHGVIGIKAQEYMQYVLNEIWNNKELSLKYNIKEELEIILDRLQKYSREDRNIIEKALIVHSYLTALWFIEDNGSISAIDKNIKIIEILLSKEKVIVRNVREEDIEQIVDLQIEGWQNAYRGIIDNNYLDNMDRKVKIEKRRKDYNKNGFIVAERDSKIVGYSRFVNNTKFTIEVVFFDCELLALYVKASIKGQGIGTLLFNEVKKRQKQDGKMHMILWCLKDNNKSRKFYEKMGGKIVTTRPVIIDNKSYDEVCYIYDL